MCFANKNDVDDIVLVQSPIPVSPPCSKRLLPWKLTYPLNIPGWKTIHSFQKWSLLNGLEKSGGGNWAVLLILHPTIQPAKDSVWSGVGAPVSFDAHVLEQRFALADARTKTVQRSAGHIPGEWPCGAPGWLFAVYIGDYNKPFKVIIRIPISQSVLMQHHKGFGCCSGVLVVVSCGSWIPEKQCCFFRKFQEAVGYHKLICWDIFVTMFMLGYF